MERETDGDWVILGDTEPFFGVLTQEKYLSQNLTEEGLEEFWASGFEEVAHTFNVIEQHLGAFNPTSALDFGCGVGRLTRAIAARTGTVTGVDISPGMLAQARKYAPDNATFIDSIPEGLVDFIFSSIVFQHIPPARGYEIFDDLLSRLAPNGAFSIHVTLFKDSRFLQHVTNRIEYGAWDGETIRHITEPPLPPGTMLMYDYELSRLMISAVRNDVHRFYIEHLDHAGCHGVRLFGRRNP